MNHLGLLLGWPDEAYAGPAWHGRAPGGDLRGQRQGRRRVVALALLWGPPA